MTHDASSASPSAELILLATDGSDAANSALRTGLALIGRATKVLLVTVVPAADPTVLVGSGHAGPVMTLSEKQQLSTARDEQARRVLDDAARFLDAVTPGSIVETAILAGDPGPEICREAAERHAAGIVLGTSGTGGLKRALLGSVSDHVVRHAPCPVVTVNAG